MSHGSDWMCLPQNLTCMKSHANIAGRIPKLKKISIMRGDMTRLYISFEGHKL